MYPSTDDILKAANSEPFWWQDGFPRFEPFKPELATVYGSQVALIHTECQDCAARFDVAVQPRGPGRNLRNVLAYSTELDVGDPPNAGHSCNAGPTMSSLEIAVLQFWEREPDWRNGWNRIPELEVTLIDGIPTEDLANPKRRPLHLQISQSLRREEWMKAREQGDFERMVKILDDFGCQRSREVAHMEDIELRRKRHRDEILELNAVRFPKA